VIHDIGLALQVRLRAAGCPVAVVDGPEPTTTATRGRERIVIEHADSDSFVPTRSQRPNPVHRLNRSVGAKITIYAQSPRAGALDFEHRRRAEHILDLVLVALGDEAGSSAIYNVWAPQSGQFITPPDLEGSERRGGAVYELAVTFERAVKVQTWAGDIAPEAELVRPVMQGNPTLTFAAADNTVTRSAGTWSADGFAVGMTVKVFGSDANNVTGVIALLSPTVMTLSGAVLADEGPTAGCVVRAGGITSDRRVTVNGTDFETI